MENLKKVVSALSEKHLDEIVALDMRTHSPMYDFTVITTAKNERIIAAVVRELKDLDGQDGLTLKAIEGRSEGEWMLADFGQIVVHVFTPETRGRYNLEKLWGDVERIDISEVITNGV